MTAPTSSSAVSQQSPYDATSTVAAIAYMVRQMLARLDTMKPVQVVGVKPGSGSPPAAGTVDVRLLVSQIDGNGNAVEGSAGTVYGLPYFRPAGGVWQVVLDPAVDDFGFVVCADRDISAVAKAIANDALPATPGSFRKYDVSDGVYVGGCFNGAPEAFVWLKPDGSFVITDGFGNSITSSAAGFVFRALTSGTGIANFVVSALQVNGVPVSVP